jgi:hypothetical protein
MEPLKTKNDNQRQKGYKFIRKKNKNIVVLKILGQKRNLKIKNKVKLNHSVF